MNLETSIQFDRAYYERIMQEFGYNPIEFEQINFTLGDLTADDLQRRWLCHHGAGEFAESLQSPFFWNRNWISQALTADNSIVSTGFGLTGTPHVGTLSQILRSITLQKAGIPVNLVLGDLDAYNGKGKPLSETLDLAGRYREFILNLGFNPEPPSILRSQYNDLDVLRTAYLIGHFMDDEMFVKSEEDLHELYSKSGKVDEDMSYRRKLSLNLMTADFINLHLRDGFKNVMVMLGIDEHKYVQFGRETVRRIVASSQLKGFDLELSGIYSAMIKGFNNYPKMSKSFPDSGITVDMSADEINKKIMKGEGRYDKPENNVVYQMMAAASHLTAPELKRNYEACIVGGNDWGKAKKGYVDTLVDICGKWRDK